MKNNEDDFLGKWLSGELSEEERKTFEDSEDYLAYKDILKGVERLERPVFDVEKGLAAQKIYNTTYKENKTLNVKSLRVWMYAAAAVVLALIGVRTLFFQEVTIKTGMAETQVIELPDHSVVTLNADATLTYDKDSFMEHRELELNGEAFFEVEKGSTFKVETKNGEITVLGTAFNVYSRGHSLEVNCYEGKVNVQNDLDKVILTEGKGTKSNEIKKFTVFEISSSKPDWLQGKSSFHEVPLERLIEELERQYNIKISRGNVDVQRKFTGFFTHDNLKVALKTSFEPMNINYTFDAENSIALKNK